MKYENLLTKIKVANLTGYDIVLIQGLKAVVKLHKPKRYINGFFCYHCDNSYPCKTIQVIEKRLIIGLDNDN